MLPCPNSTQGKGPESSGICHLKCFGICGQIENEDDLDDAKRPEDREKEEKTPDTAPPQEENAIEMSDDFDGTTEDAPATEVWNFHFGVCCIERMKRETWIGRWTDSSGETAGRMVHRKCRRNS